jgi:hypothetical protein
VTHFGAAVCAAAGVRGVAVAWLAARGWAWRLPGPSRDVTAERFPSIDPAEPLDDAEWPMVGAEGDERSEVAHSALRARGEAAVSRLLATQPRDLPIASVSAPASGSAAALLPVLAGTRRERRSYIWTMRLSQGSSASASATTCSAPTPGTTSPV